MTQAVSTHLAFLERAQSIEDQIRSMPQAVVGEELDELCPVEHAFTPGQYVREMTCPAGVLVVTALHARTHPFFLLEGEVSVLTASGVARLTAPHYGITPAGTKRIVYTHSATRWVTVHATEKTTPEEVEAEVIASGPDDLNLSEQDLARLMGANP